MTSASALSSPLPRRPRLSAPSASGVSQPAASHPDLDWIAATVTRRTGLTFPASRLGLLQRAVHRWLATCDDETRDRIDRRLLPSDEAWNRLVSLVTVGETYFFRHEEQLDLLRAEILPGLIRERVLRGDRRLRAWCAGCSTGEEAYTIAILLLEALPDPKAWDLRILGTDIDEEALAIARAARYSRWALRVEGPYRDRWLRQTAGGRHELVPELKSLVEFASHNLVGASDWPPAPLGGPADLILCRNVTMYMATDTVRQVTDDFWRALVPGGWLMLGPAEPVPEGAYLRRSIGGFVFSQRPPPNLPTANPSHLSLPARRPPATVSSPAPMLAVSRPAESPSFPKAPRVGGGRSAQSKRDPTTIAQAQAIADAGRLDEAEAMARGLAQAGRLEPAAFRLLATIAEARGDLDAACHALGRALYLAPNDPLCLFRLGLLEWRRGRVPQARTRMRATLAALEPRADADVIDPEHGIAVGAIRSVARSLVS